MGGRRHGWVVFWIQRLSEHVLENKKTIKNGNDATGPETYKAMQLMEHVQPRHVIALFMNERVGVIRHLFRLRLGYFRDGVYQRMIRFSS